MSSASPCASQKATEWGYIWIRITIDSPHPPVRHKRRLNGAVIRMRPGKPRSRITAGVADKDHPLLKSPKCRA
jgi:hypothetical protein